jgi:hypothetical protein
MTARRQLTTLDAGPRRERGRSFAQPALKKQAFEQEQRRERASSR